MIEIGPISIRLYGLIIGFGILVGFWVAARMARKFKIQDSRFKIISEQVWDALLWIAVPGVLGARLYHVVGEWDFYRENLFLIPQLWRGGLGIFGGIAGGLLGVWLFVRQNKISFLSAADLAAFGMPIGQAIGRWGNFFNQELYGKPTDLPWGIQISVENRVVGFEKFTHFHPLFLYESLLSLLTFGLLIAIWWRKGAKIKQGSYFAIYLVMYGIGRFWLEVVKLETWRVEGFAVAQVVSIAFVILGAVVFLNRNMSNKNSQKL